MNPQQIDRVRASWARVSPVADTVARLFCRRLFELEPARRDCLTTSVTGCEDELLDLLDGLVTRLDETAPIDLGPGAADEAVSTALVWSLGETLGEAFSAADRDAWRALVASDVGDQLAATLPREERELAAV